MLRFERRGYIFSSSLNNSRHKPDWGQKHTFVHCTQHAGRELIDGIALLDERDEGCDTALVVGRGSKIGENKFLELIHLILQIHELADGLVAGGWQKEGQRKKYNIIRPSVVSPRIATGGLYNTHPARRGLTLRSDHRFPSKRCIRYNRTCR